MRRKKLRVIGVLKSSLLAGVFGLSALGKHAYLNNRSEKENWIEAFTPAQRESIQAAFDKVHADLTPASKSSVFIRDGRYLGKYLEQIAGCIESNAKKSDHNDQDFNQLIKKMETDLDAIKAIATNNAEKLVGYLGEDDFDKRLYAEMKLVSLGGANVPALEKALEKERELERLAEQKPTSKPEGPKPDPERKYRLGAILEKLKASAEYLDCLHYATESFYNVLGPHTGYNIHGCEEVSFRVRNPPSSTPAEVPSASSDSLKAALKKLDSWYKPEPGKKMDLPTRVVALYTELIDCESLHTNEARPKHDQAVDLEKCMQKVFRPWLEFWKKSHSNSTREVCPGPKTWKLTPNMDY